MNSALHTAGGLAVVIALILGVAWLLRGAQRFGLRGHGLLRIVASQALGTRERVVVVELADTWLVLGVAPGQVARLARLPRAQLPLAPLPLAPLPLAPLPPAGAATPQGTASGMAGAPGTTAAPQAFAFQTWLARAMQRK